MNKITPGSHAPMVILNLQRWHQDENAPARWPIPALYRSAASWPFGEGLSELRQFCASTQALTDRYHCGVPSAPGARPSTTTPPQAFYEPCVNDWPSLWQKARLTDALKKLTPKDFSF